MFITVLRFNKNTEKKQEYPVDFKNMDFLHRWLTSQFDTSRAESHILFSLCPDKGDLYFYIQSDTELPKKNIERAGMEFVKSFEVPGVENGDKVYFKLYCTTIARNKERNNKKSFINDEKRRSDWLIKRLSNSLCDVNAKEVRISSSMIKGGVNIPGVEFVGTGTVLDKDKFYEMIQNGIGMCKNYGFGMMMYKVS